eukprot:363259-Chlamydomonas_euryale.AAC.5
MQAPTRAREVTACPCKRQHILGKWQRAHASANTWSGSDGVPMQASTRAREVAHAHTCADTCPGSDDMPMHAPTRAHEVMACPCKRQHILGKWQRAHASANTCSGSDGVPMQASTHPREVAASPCKRQHVLGK